MKIRARPATIFSRIRTIKLLSFSARDELADALDEDWPEEYPDEYDELPEEKPEYDEPDELPEELFAAMRSESEGFADDEPESSVGGWQRPQGR